MQVTSWKPALTVECVGVQKVLVPIGEEIVGPDLERRHGNSGLYVFNDYHRQLKAILGSKIDGLSLEMESTAISKLSGSKSAMK